MVLLSKATVMVWRMAMVLLAVLAFGLQAAWAEPFETPKDGTSWQMHWIDKDVGGTVLGDVRYVGGRYELKLTGVEYQGKITPVAMNATIRSEPTSTGTIRFKIPKMELRSAILIPQPVVGSLASNETATNQAWDDIAKEVAAQVSDPAYQLGGFVDGQLVAPEEFERLSSAPTLFDERKLPLYLRPFNETKRAGYTLQPHYNAPSKTFRLNLPWGIQRATGKAPDFSFEYYEKVLPTDVPITTLFAHSGYELTLTNPWTEKGSKSIWWDWSLKVETKTTYETGGDREEATPRPIVFGPKPEIIATIVSDDQLGRTSDRKREAKLPYPFNAEGTRVRTPSFVARADRRNVFVVGRNIAEDGRFAQVDLKESDEDLRYFKDVHSGLSGLKEFIDRHKSQEPIDGITQLIMDEAAKVGDDVQVVHLNVWLSEGIKAGEKTVLVSNEPAKWRLAFGDNEVTLRFVRTDLPRNVPAMRDVLKVGKDAGGGEELARHIFMRDQIVIEAKVGGNQEVTELDVLLQNSRDGHMRVADGLGKVKLTPTKPGSRIFRSREFVVVDRSKLDNKAWSELPESRPPNPNIVHDNPEYVPQDMALALRPETVLRARLLDQSGDLRQRPVPEDTVTVNKDATKVYGLFIDALKQSYQCAGFKLPSFNWQEVTLEQQSEVSSRAFLKTTRLVTKITHGEHAALLMVKDLFLKRLRRVRTGLASFQESDDNLRAYFEAWRTRQIDSDAPDQIWDMPVSLPAGKKRPFSEWLDDYKALDDTQRVGIAYSSVQAQLDNMDKTLKLISGVDACDSPELVFYFGDSANNLIQDIMPTLMREEINSRGMRVVRPDIIARTMFGNISSIKLQIRANELIAQQDTNTIKAMLFVATAPVGYLPSVAALGAGAATAVATGVLAAEATDLALTAMQNYDKSLSDDKRLRFARGGDPVLDDGFLEAVEEDQDEKLWLVADTMASALGVVSAGLELGGAVAKGISTVSDTTRIASTVSPLERAAQTLSRLDDGALNDRARLGVFIAEKLQSQLDAAGNLPSAWGAMARNLPSEDISSLMAFLAKNPRTLSEASGQRALWRNAHLAMREAATQAKSTAQTVTRAPGLSQTLAPSAQTGAGAALLQGLSGALNANKQAKKAADAILDANDFKQNFGENNPFQQDGLETVLPAPEIPEFTPPVINLPGANKVVAPLPN